MLDVKKSAVNLTLFRCLLCFSVAFPLFQRKNKKPDITLTFSTHLSERFRREHHYRLCILLKAVFYLWVNFYQLSTKALWVNPTRNKKSVNFSQGTMIPLNRTLSTNSIILLFNSGAPFNT